MKGFFFQNDAKEKKYAMTEGEKTKKPENDLQKPKNFKNKFAFFLLLLSANTHHLSHFFLLFFSGVII